MIQYNKDINFQQLIEYLTCTTGRNTGCEIHCITKQNTATYTGWNTDHSMSWTSGTTASEETHCAQTHDDSEHQCNTASLYRSNNMKTHFWNIKSDGD